MKTYGEKLKDPRWQKKRLEIMERDKFTCQTCGDSNSELHVHHRLYERGKDPWDYPDENYVTLCAYCHQSIEHLASQIRCFGVNYLYLSTLFECHLIMAHTTKEGAIQFSRDVRSLLKSYM